MSAKQCKCGTPRLHAKAVADAVFQCLVNAYDPAREQHWRSHAELLERKFTTEHGKHYSLFLEAA